MSRLKVFPPRGSEFEHRIYTEENDEPVILAFKPRSNRMPQQAGMDLLTRARVLSRNARCPNCGHGVVEPLDLGDARLDRAHQPVPCSSTLVGFYCHRCDSEWTV